MQINKISSSGVLALAFGVFLTVCPAAAETIAFKTGPDQMQIGTGAYDYNFGGADVPQYTAPTVGGITFSGPGLSMSFGEFVFKNNTPNSSVVSVDVAPTINGTAATSVDFSGLIAVTGGTPTITFSGPTETINGTTFVYQNSNGVQYAIQATQNLPTSTNKISFLVGYVGVAVATSPEPATMATTGLALLLAGFVARRKTKSSS